MCTSVPSLPSCPPMQLPVDEPQTGPQGQRSTKKKKKKKKKVGRFSGSRAPRTAHVVEHPVAKAMAHAEPALAKVGQLSAQPRLSMCAADRAGRFHRLVRRVHRDSDPNQIGHCADHRRDEPQDVAEAMRPARQSLDPASQDVGRCECPRATRPLATASTSSECCRTRTETLDTVETARAPRGAAAQED